MTKRGLGKFIAGLGLGVGLGVLFAPKSGKETRADIAEKFDELVEKVKNIDVQETKEQIIKKMNQLKKDLKDLDKEKVKKMTQAEIKKLKKSLDELVELTKEKCTPVVEKAANELRTRVSLVLKSAADKLDEKAEKLKNN